MLLDAYLFTLLSVCVLASLPDASDMASKKKAGISWPAQEKSSDPVNKFFPYGSNISWSYNWGRDYHTGFLADTSPGFKIMGEFVPMFWTGTDAENLNLQPGYTHILGFNEPDLKGSDKANAMTTADAITKWNLYKGLRKDNVKLVSPGVAGDFSWLKSFHDDPALVVKPDIIAVHVYADTLQGVKDKIKDYRVFKKPLWITEFAMHSFDANAQPPKNQQAVHDFMGQVTKWMDEDPQIERYAWFGAVSNPALLGDVHPFNRLMDDKGELTALGWQYVWGGHH